MFKPLLLIFIILSFILSLCAKAQSNANGVHIKPVDMHSTLLFLENKGQIKDQNGNARDDIQYKLSGNGINVFIGNGQLHYQFNRVDKNGKNSMNAMRNADPARWFALRQFDTGGSMVKSYRIDVTLMNANKNAQLITGDQQNYYEHYYNYQFGESGLIVHSYKKITYKNIYPNIDWVLYINNNKLEYDFIVHPGGNVADIKLMYAGASTLALDKDNRLCISSPMGNIIEEKPSAYEQESQKKVCVTPVLKNSTVTLRNQSYKGTLIIDPKLDWGTYYNVSWIGSIKTDPWGYIYVYGPDQFGSDNTATTGAFETIRHTIHDVFLTKFNTRGERLWATFYGSGGHSAAGIGDGTSGQGLVCDKYGNVYISGNTSEDTGIATPGHYQDTIYHPFPTFFDAFVAKFDSSGARIWGTYFGYNDIDRALTTDTSGNIYLFGETFASDKIASPAAWQTTYEGAYDAFLVKFNASGKRLWSTYYGGSGYDAASSVYCDQSNNVYISGTTNSKSNIATSGSFQTMCGLSFDGYLVKFDSTGARKWATYFGGTGAELGYGTCDHSGNIYVSGTTTSDTQIATAGTFQPTRLDTLPTPFIIKFNSSGARLWGTYIGKPKYAYYYDYIVGIATDLAGNLFISGTTSSNDNIATINGYKPYPEDNWNNIFISKIAKNGQHLWGSYYGAGSLYNWQEPYQFIACSADNNIYLSGNTFCRDSIATSNAYQTILDTNLTRVGDGYIAKFINDTNLVINQPYIDTFLCTGAKWNVAYTMDYNLHLGNIFTVQLSDSAGRFGSPINIGSITSNQDTGTIQCTLPASTIPGNHYRIRVVSSNPVFIGTDDYFDIRIVHNIDSLSCTDNAPVCAGDTMKLDATSFPPGMRYQWLGPDSFSNNGQHIIIYPARTINSGKYVIKSFAPGCPAITDTIMAIVNEIPGTPAILSNAPICMEDTLKLNATDTTAGVSYHWQGPSGFNDTSVQPRIFPAKAGQYSVYTSLKRCESRPDTIDVSFRSAPQRPVFISNSPICANDTLKIELSDTAMGASFYLFGPSGFKCNAKDTSIIHAAGGIYTAYIRDKYGCRSDTDTTNITVLPLPATPVITINTPLCDYDTLHMSAADTSNLSFHWSGPTFSSTLKFPSLFPPLSGHYKVWVIDSNGCRSDTADRAIEVIARPVTPEINAPDSICAYDTLQLLAIDTGTGLNFVWTLPDNTNDYGASLKVYPPVNGDYYVKAVMRNMCYSFPDSTNIKVVNTVTPSVSIITSPQIKIFPVTMDTFYAKVVNGGLTPRFQWARNGIDLVGATSNPYISNIIKKGDVISVKVHSNATCALPANITATTKPLNEIVDNGSYLILYPNPNNGHFTVRGLFKNIQNEHIAYDVVNAIGQYVYSGIASINNGMLLISVSLGENIAGDVFIFRLYAAGDPYNIPFTLYR